MVNRAVKIISWSSVGIIVSLTHSLTHSEQPLKIIVQSLIQFSALEQCEAFDTCYLFCPGSNAHDFEKGSMTLRAGSVC